MPAYRETARRASARKRVPVACEQRLQERVRQLGTVHLTTRLAPVRRRPATSGSSRDASTRGNAVRREKYTSKTVSNAS